MFIVCSLGFVKLINIIYFRFNNCFPWFGRLRWMMLLTFWSHIAIMIMDHCCCFLSSTVHTVSFFYSRFGSRTWGQRQMGLGSAWGTDTTTEGCHILQFVLSLVTCSVFARVLYYWWLFSIISYYTKMRYFDDWSSCNWV